MLSAYEDVVAQLPQWFWTLTALLFGATWGSFLNVVIYRVPRGKSLLFPGSQCPHCDKPIAWYDNVPVLSWLWLGGKCRQCKDPISARYPAIELAVALLSWALILRFGPSGAYVAAFVFMLLLVSVSAIDLDLWLIPDAISYPGMVLGLLSAALLPGMAFADHALGALAGAGVLWAVAMLAKVVLKKDGMGLGDVKLLAMIGAFMGPRALVPVILLASFQGALLGAIWLRLHKNDPPPPPQEDGFVPPPGAVPFGPFLSLAALQVLFFSEQIAAVAERFIL